jgi:hypothetical protein
MEDIQLSVLVAGIRPWNWKALYDSVAASFSKSWEIIFVGPYPPPDDLSRVSNCIFKEDWGTPMRAQQIALTMARGKFCTWVADDGVFLPHALDEAFTYYNVDDWISSPMHGVIGRYWEGSGDHSAMNNPEYYRLNWHDGARGRWIPDDCLLLNLTIAPTETIKSFGGWDCGFEVIPMALCDLGVRVHLAGMRFRLCPGVLYTCSHMPERTGDHGPIHDAQTYVDMPLFKRIWDGPTKPDRIYVALDNWKNVPERWERRFGKA